MPTLLDQGGSDVLASTTVFAFQVYTVNVEDTSPQVNQPESVAHKIAARFTAHWHQE